LEATTLNVLVVMTTTDIPEEGIILQVGVDVPLDDILLVVEEATGTTVQGDQLIAIPTTDIDLRPTDILQLTDILQVTDILLVAIDILQEEIYILRVTTDTPTDRSTTIQIQELATPLVLPVTADTLGDTLQVTVIDTRPILRLRAEATPADTLEDATRHLGAADTETATETDTAISTEDMARPTITTAPSMEEAADTEEVEAADTERVEAADTERVEATATEAATTDTEVEVTDTAAETDTVGEIDTASAEIDTAVAEIDMAAAETDTVAAETNTAAVTDTTTATAIDTEATLAATTETKETAAADGSSDRTADLDVRSTGNPSTNRDPLSTAAPTVRGPTAGPSPPAQTDPFTTTSEESDPTDRTVRGATTTTSSTKSAIVNVSVASSSRSS
jgi:hypothetical protein